MIKTCKFKIKYGNTDRLNREQWGLHSRVSANAPVGRDGSGPDVMDGNEK
jgi:hypothetical protein